MSSQISHLPATDEVSTHQLTTTRLLAGVLLINIFVIVVATVAMYESRIQYQLQAETSTQNLSRILDEYLAGTIEKINVALFALSNEYERQLSGKGVNSQAMNEYIRREYAILPYLDSMRIADAQGLITYGIGVASGSRSGITDRDYFIYLRDNPAASLVVSKPVVGKISGKWVIIFARRLGKPDGTFAGVVYAVITLEQLSKTFSSLDVGKNGVISLRDAEMSLIARHPDSKVDGIKVGSRIVSKELQQLIKAGQTAGTYDTPTGSDNIPRKVSFHKVADYPLYIIVGLAEEEYLAEWHALAIKASAVVGIFIVCTLFAFWLLYRSLGQQRAAFQAMREQKKFLDTVLENEPECVKVIAPNGNLQQMNGAGLAMLEVDTLLEAKKAGLLSFVVPEYHDAFSGLLKRVLGGETGMLEFPIEGKKGTHRWLETHASPLRDVKGDVVSLVAVTRDITDRKQLENALKESELRYRTVADYTSDWEYWIMEDNSFRFVSPSSEQVSGYTPQEFYADPQLLPNIIFPEDLHLYTGHVHQVNSQGFSEPIDFRILTKTGEIRWISHVCRPVYDAAGQHIGQRASNRDISERKAAEEQIRNLAFYDTLTKLPNRRLLNDRLAQTMTASKRNGRHAALMFLDLDNFKPLNDTHGHAVGDLLLVEVARRINSCVREVDTVARFGGDEFIVMLTELDTDKAVATKQAAVVAEKIREMLEKPYLLPIHQQGKAENMIEHHCTSSIGVVVFINHEASTEDIFKRADMAMYQAKLDGRNMIRFCDKQCSPDEKANAQDSKILRLIWRESYRCGEPVIDQEHEKLFDLSNTLIEAAFTRNENPQQFDFCLEKLLAHVVQHFADEEAILAKHDYADLDNHAQAHKVLVEHALQLRNAITAGGGTIGELVNFIAGEVVAQHMLTVDRQFYSLFKVNPINAGN